MLRRSFRSGLRLGLLVGVALAVYRVLQARQAQPELPSRDPWPPVAPPEPVPAVDPVVEPAPAQAWVEPGTDGACPVSHPIKGKLSSKIFHLPGMFAYDRTKADRCYATEVAAEADGLHRAKR